MRVPLFTKLLIVCLHLTLFQVNLKKYIYIIIVSVYHINKIFMSKVKSQKY